MTTQDIIRQTQSFTIEQKQELLYCLLFSILGEDKKQEFANLFHYKDDIAEVEKKTAPNNICNTIDKLCGSGKNLWKEDAQVYINKSREDDRQF